ncbi:NhaP-type Na+/H+ or K+/H+ antiporter [Agromyces terreus]|uniref:NhaP-type Na+/H+ or K+/H+ antiporter n=1 Tax=Agromyces terreus TaxID=424795 RepID=A0A9X2H601_9MICO|nr:cation:proton antiporter [Agromyces terreus]MCP2370034.1 NhaP-type Na+/H+ or K+/H+ antiporter [Agromyces terreus]
MRQTAGIEALLLSFALVLLAAILISGVAHRTVLSTTVLFLAAGFVLGSGMLDVIELAPADPVVTTISSFALFVVLFTDGQEVGLRELRAAWKLPGRALLLGMPITFVISTLLGVWLLDLSWLEAMLVAAVLAPTDPVFASAIVGRGEIPFRVRNLLGVESGLNDGLALPVVLILISAIGGPDAEAWELIVELGSGIAIGILVPLIVSWLVRLRVFSRTPLYAALTPIAVMLIVLGVCLATHANLYLAAFSAGITIATVAPEMRDAFHEFGGQISELVKLLAVLMFGALISPQLLADVPFAGYLYAILLLVLARPLAVELSLLGSGLPWEERATAAWFGPKGFASVLYGLLVLSSGAENADYMFHVIVVAIVLSIVAHSSTDVPIAAWFARREAEDVRTGRIQVPPSSDPSRANPPS